MEEKIIIIETAEDVINADVFNDVEVYSGELIIRFPHRNRQLYVSYSLDDFKLTRISAEVKVKDRRYWTINYYRNGQVRLTNNWPFIRYVKTPLMFSFAPHYRRLIELYDRKIVMYIYTA